MKFRELAKYFERLEATTKRLEMTEILAELFKNPQINKDEVDKIIYLCQGQLLPVFKDVVFGISEKILHKAIIDSSSYTSEKITDLFQKLGDYGEVAQELCKGHKQSQGINDVHQKLMDIALASGAGAVTKKVSLLSRLIKDLSSVEAKYAIRIILGRLRLGVGDPTVLDSLSLAKQGDKALRRKLERAYNLCSDLGLVAKILFSKGIRYIDEFKVIVGCPIRVALAARLPNPQEIIDKIGPCAVEAKYDGFRCQVHKDGQQVRIFSRNLEDTTHMFPEIKDAVAEKIKQKKVVFEGEALAYDTSTGKCLPFQVTVQRKRKYDIEQMQRRFPLKLFVFDILYTDSDGDLAQVTYKKRRQIMSQVISDGQVLQKSPFKIVKTAEELTKIFEDALAEGREGIIAKRLEAGYQAGGRNFNWIKLKRTYEDRLSDTIDCVIVGYYFGKGQRASFGIGSLLGCVYDKNNNQFKTVAKIGSGLSEDQLIKLKKILDKIKLKEKPKNVDSELEPDIWVTPKFVVEVQADEITRSPVHTCGKIKDKKAGFALRFPRAVNFIRTDKDAQDATSVAEVINMFKLQGRKS